MGITEKTGSIITISKNMMPNKDDFIEAGFFFFDLYNQEETYGVALPSGWIKQDHKEGNGRYSSIYDEFGNKRAAMSNDHNKKTGSVIQLLHRYDVRSIIDLCDTHIESTIYFGSEDEMLYVAGVIAIPLEAGMENTIAATCHKELKDKDLRKNARAWGEEHYENYRNPNAYWGEKEKILEKK